MSLYLLALLLPLGVRPMPALACLKEDFSKTVKFRVCSLPLLWEMHRRARGFRTTKCYPSVVCSISRHFAIDFFPFVQHANGNGMWTRSRTCDFCEGRTGCTTRAVVLGAWYWGRGCGDKILQNEATLPSYSVGLRLKGPNVAAWATSVGVAFQEGLEGSDAPWRHMVLFCRAMGLVYPQMAIQPRIISNPQGINGNH